MKLYCKKCNREMDVFKREGDVHVGLFCSEDHWLKWVSKKDAAFIPTREQLFSRTREIVEVVRKMLIKAGEHPGDHVWVDMACEKFGDWLERSDA